MTMTVTTFQKLRKTLQLPEGSDPSQLCCCHEELGDPATYWDTKGTLHLLNYWWGRLLAAGNGAFEPSACFTDDTYLDIVSR